MKDDGQETVVSSSAKILKDVVVQVKVVDRKVSFNLSKTDIYINT